MNAGRLFIASNRLPVCISGEPEQKIVSPGSGEFVDSVNKYLENCDPPFTDMFWVGIPGCTPSTWNDATTRLEESRFKYIPVLVYREQYDRYYDGFSNTVLWPLFHSSDVPPEYNEDDYEHYVQVNEHFYEILSRHIRKNDTVWIYDYHLLFLPGMLRRHIPGLTIGFFLPVPYPSYSSFIRMSEKLQHGILNGLTGASYIGFRHSTDAEHFKESAVKTKDVVIRKDTLRIGERSLHVLVLPVNSDFEKLKIAAGLSFQNAEAR